MNNREALDLLDEFTETLSYAIQASVWARAFLQEGGEPTWDAVKSVCGVAETLAQQAERIETFRDQYEAIVP